jgi:hypothetical protein
MDVPMQGPKSESQSPQHERSVPKVGDTLTWETLGGEHFSGRVVEMDSNVAHVLLPDGRKKCVEC